MGGGVHNKHAEMPDANSRARPHVRLNIIIEPEIVVPARSTAIDPARPTHATTQMLTQRAGTPVFDMIIELQRGKLNTWLLVRNVAPAVDDLLRRGSYGVERRTRLEGPDADRVRQMIWRLAILSFSIRHAVLGAHG